MSIASRGGTSRTLARIAALLLLPFEAHSSMLYYIQHGERLDNHLLFMYKPIIETLKHLKPSLFVYNNQVNVSTIPPNSTFVWVGIHNVHQVPWQKIRSLGVKTVYYQTEPVERCFLTKAVVDEMWDYSWHNINNCKRMRGLHSKKKPLIRYIPVAYQAWTPSVVPTVSHKTFDFFGHTKWRDSCYKQIDMGWRTRTIQSVWNETAFEKYIGGSHGIFININKGCRNFGPLPPRISLLLSTKGVVVSTRCHENDENMFKEFVLFVDNITYIPPSMIEDHIRSRDIGKFSVKFKADTILQNAGLL